MSSFNRSSLVRIEAFVSVNCSITSATTYVWRLFNASTHEPLSLADFNLTQHVFHDPVFFIPPRHLPYGRYVVELRVCTGLHRKFSVGKITSGVESNQTLRCKMWDILLVSAHLCLHCILPLLVILQLIIILTFFTELNFYFLL